MSVVIKTTIPRSQKGSCKVGKNYMLWQFTLLQVIHHFLSTFRKKIDEGSIVTWSYDEDGDFTHTAKQWENLAWLRPRIHAERLALFIFPPQNTKLSIEIYAIYHGRFIESIVAHCDTLFIRGIATALPEGEDVIE
jgi:hypothetical protein